jgi:hypothetical protein
MQWSRTERKLILANLKSKNLMSFSLILAMYPRGREDKKEGPGESGHLEPSPIVLPTPMPQ